MKTEAKENQENFFKEMVFQSQIRYECETLSDKIVNRYEHRGVKLKIKKYIFHNNTFKFKVKLSKDTRVNDLKKFAQDVRLGVKLSKLEVLVDDTSIWIIASRKNQTSVLSLTHIFKNAAYEKFINGMKLAHPLGLNSSGDLIIKDLTLYPHILIAGSTNSGKSVAVKVLLASILRMYSPKKVNAIICDQTGDLLLFNGLPHLSCPVITDFDAFYCALQALNDEMNRRIKLKDSPEYKSLPYILFVADEFATFISGNEPRKKDARVLVESILRRGRHARIHAVLVAFNPTRQNLKIDIADLPTKMVFRVSRSCNSLSVLGIGGAEKLSGNGDMLFQSSQSDEPQRIQGAFISHAELNRLLALLKIKWASLIDSNFIFRINTNKSAVSAGINSDISEKGNYKHALFSDIIIWAMGKSTVSANELMKNFNKGWNGASDAMTQLEKQGIIEPLRSKTSRQVLIHSPSDLSEEILDFLTCHGHTIEEISAILERKIQSRPDE